MFICVLLSFYYYQPKPCELMLLLHFMRHIQIWSMLSIFCLGFTVGSKSKLDKTWKRIMMKSNLQWDRLYHIIHISKKIDWINPKCSIRSFICKSWYLFFVVKAYSWQFEELNFHDQKMNNNETSDYVIPKTHCVNICSEGIQDGVTYWYMKILSKTKTYISSKTNIKESEREYE